MTVDCPWNSPGKNTGDGIPLSSISSQPRDWTLVSCMAHRFFTISAAREAWTVRQSHRQKHLNVQLLENHFRHAESGPQVGGIKGQLHGLISNRNQWPCPSTCSLPHPLLSALPLSVFPGYVKEKDRVISVSYTKPLDISLDLQGPSLYFGTFHSALKVSSDPVSWRVTSDKEVTSC